MSAPNNRFLRSSRFRGKLWATCLSALFEKIILAVVLAVQISKWLLQCFSRSNFYLIPYFTKFSESQTTQKSKTPSSDRFAIDSICQSAKQNAAKCSAKIRFKDSWKCTLIPCLKTLQRRQKSFPSIFTVQSVFYFIREQHKNPFVCAQSKKNCQSVFPSVKF